MSDTCLGPIDPATHVPVETCPEAATKMLLFPHQSGVAFMFCCGRHLAGLGQWAGMRFGGCFVGGPIEKGARPMSDAAAKFGRIDIPHGEDFDALVGIPGGPKSFRGGLSRKWVPRSWG